MREKLYLLSAPVLTGGAGIYRVKTLTPKQAKAELETATEIVSAVGHETSAEVMSEVLEVDVKMSRIEIRQEPGSAALCLRLKRRAAEGAILNKQDIQGVGFEWLLVEYEDELSTRVRAAACGAARYATEVASQVISPLRAELPFAARVVAGATALLALYATAKVLRGDR